MVENDENMSQEAEIEETPEEREQRIAEEENPQPPDPAPEIDPPYGKVVYVKGDTSKAPEDADIVIEDQMVPIIVKNRNGVTGSAASPELIDYADVIE
jgi:hypothetical protein